MVYNLITYSNELTNQCETPMQNGMIFYKHISPESTRQYDSLGHETKTIPPHWHHLTFWMAEMLETGAFWPSTNTHIQHLQRHLQRNLEICHHSVFRSEVFVDIWPFLWPFITSQTCCCFFCDHDIKKCLLYSVTQPFPCLAYIYLTFGFMLRRKYG